MTSEHTPGPWRAVIRKNQTGVRMAAVDMAPHGRSWEPRRNGLLPDYEEANARLIAAAPEMLEALKMFLAPHTSPSIHEPTQVQLEQAVDAALAAIAKAEGK